MTLQGMAKHIELWAIDRLIPYAKNPRTHSDAQIAQIAASITEFGFNSPILVDSKAGIIAGHGRLLAARKLKLKEVPVIILDHLSEAQKRAYILADNQLAINAGWDDDLLRIELAALRDDDFNLDLLGFGDEELARLLADGDAVQGLTGEDAVPDVPEAAVTMTGDLWVLNEHRLICSDALNVESFERLMAGGLSDMVFCDPPYSVAYTGKTSRKLKIKNDDLGEGFGSFLRDACTNLLAFNKGAIYICMSSSELHTLKSAFEAAGGHWSTFVIWAKHHFTLGRSDYQRQYEPILYGWRDGTDHFWCGDRDQGDVWFIKRPMANLEHPTMKPVELVERAIRNSSKSRDTVLDAFGGSGSTLIACEKTRRQGRLIELDPIYCDVTIRRWEQYTGKKATLEGDKRCFEEIAHERRRQMAS
jgi:DNA modification methylase